jgi:hypothetical protein
MIDDSLAVVFGVNIFVTSGEMPHFTFLFA